MNDLITVSYKLDIECKNYYFYKKEFIIPKGFTIEEHKCPESPNKGTLVWSMEISLY